MARRVASKGESADERQWRLSAAKSPDDGPIPDFASSDRAEAMREAKGAAKREMRATEDRSSVADASAGLVGAMAASTLEAERAVAHAAVSVFDKGNAAVERELDAAFLGIVETRLAVDVSATYERLVADLRMGEKRIEFGVTLKQVDDAETNAREAFGLWMAASYERKRWELENDVVFSAMRTQALHFIQQEKKSGERSKAVTEKDIDLKCAELFPDEWRAQELKRKRVELLEADMKHLAEMWNQRVKSLGAMLGKQRG